MKKTFG